MLQKLAVYIHWPFCKSKCPYCDFNSYVREEVDQADWVKSYIEELRHYYEMLGKREVVSIFFGGGTPSLMEVSTLDTIIKEIDNLWGIPEGIEVTLEANPTSVEVEKFKGFKTAGVNRLSLGVQSLHDEDLEVIGRKHSVAEALEALKTASNIFDRYSFDLIYARPNQTLKEWRAELNRAIELSSGHMSLYQLTIEEGTKFYTLKQKGQLTIPENELAAEMFEVTQDLMIRNNIPAYEVSNHAKLGEESQHNLVYWNYGDYIGIGAGAHGRITVDGKKLATQNQKVPEKWRKTVSKPELEVLDSEEQLYERIMMGLRLTNGIEWDDNFYQVIEKNKLQTMIDENYIIFENNYIKVTSKGMQRLNSVLIYIL